MFKRIYKYRITIWSPKGCSSLYNSEALFAMENLWAMIEWQYRSFVTDCKRTGPLSDWGTNVKKWDRFGIRNVARMTSYINLLCSLESITKQCFIQTINLGNQFFPKKFVFDSIKQKKLERDLIIAREYRNKLTAHTAYGSPKENDLDENLSTRLTSLLYLQGGGFVNHDPLSFHFGGTQIVAGNLYSKFFRQRFSMHDFHPQLKSHHMEWEELFLKMLQHYKSQCPIQVGNRKIV